MLNYTDITQNTYIQSLTVTDIMTIKMCGLLRCRRTVASLPARQRDLAMHWPWRVHYRVLVNCETQACLLFLPTWNIAICILCTVLVMVMQMLLSKNIEDVTPKGEFRLEAYLHVFSRHSWQWLSSKCSRAVWKRDGTNAKHARELSWDGAEMSTFFHS